jgi:hypothetical protein
MLAVEFTGVGGLLSFGNVVFLPMNKYMMVFDVSENASANCCALCTLNLLVTREAMCLSFTVGVVFYLLIYTMIC